MCKIAPPMPNHQNSKAKANTFIRDNEVPLSLQSPNMCRGELSRGARPHEETPFLYHISILLV